MSDTNKRLKAVRVEIGDSMIKHKLTWVECMALLSIIAADVALFQGMSKEKFLEGMGEMYDATVEKDKEGKSCH